MLESFDKSLAASMTFWARSLSNYLSERPPAISGISGNDGEKLNRNPSLGPISRYLVFGFIYPSKVSVKWADDHKVGLGQKMVQRRLTSFLR